MIRVVSTFCVGLMGFTILTLYHVSEETRVAHQNLSQAQKQIDVEQTQISVLEAQWQKAASPETIQRMAEGSLGMQNATTVQLASTSQLPRRSDQLLNGDPVQTANAQITTVPTPVLRAAVRSGM